MENNTLHNYSGGQGDSMAGKAPDPSSLAATTYGPLSTSGEVPEHRAPLGVIQTPLKKEIYIYKYI